MKQSRAIVLIPAFNEEGSIEQVLSNIRTNVPQMDILVVNDHSTDRTRPIVDSIGVTQIYLPCNLGYGRALQIGCSWAIEEGYEYVIFVDGDGQHPASEIIPMVEKLKKGEGDMIIASRYTSGDSRGSSFGRFFGNQLFSRMASFLTGQRITDSTSGMKAIGPSVLPIIAKGGFLDMHAEILVYLGRRGFRLTEHPALFAEREAGTSMYGTFALISYPLLTSTLILCSVVRAWLDKYSEGEK